MAVAVLAATGLALAELMGAGLRSERDSRSRERTLANEERVLAALSLLRREDFDGRLGRHQLGEFIVNIERPEATLYRIAVADITAPKVEALVTVVYRRAGGNGQQE